MRHIVEGTLLTCGKCGSEETDAEDVIGRRIFRCTRCGEEVRILRTMNITPKTGIMSIKN